jgi:hypothetical protein
VNLRCPKALPPALRSGPDGAHAVANQAFCAKAALANLGLPSRCGGPDPCWVKEGPTRYWLKQTRFSLKGTPGRSGSRLRA